MNSEIQTSFFWHDYETFGTQPRRDWPAQFAGVRTDADLVEIDAPVQFHCQPPLDRLPEPEACLLTGLTPQRVAHDGLIEAEFARRIHAELSRPGTIGVGYNSIRFDDEVSRFLFWRNLIEPYGREWQNGCSRWDLLDALRCAWALRPDGLVWPTHPDGRPSFKLEDLSAANGLPHDSAHDALSDVRATLALARKLRQAQPRLFDFCLKLRSKAAVQKEIATAQGQGRPFLHISGMYGTDRGGLAVVWPLANHPVNRNEVIVWDLAFDPAELMTLDAETARRRLFNRAEALPAGETRLPIKTIHINKSPVVISSLGTLSRERAAHWGIDIDQALRHAEVAAQLSPSLLGLWTEVYGEPANPAENRAAARPDVDEDLYGGFLSANDRKLLDQLRAMSFEQLAVRLIDRPPLFEDERLDELLLRYRARNAPQTLEPAEQQRWQQHCHARLIEGQGGALTLETFMNRLDALGQALYGEDDGTGSAAEPNEAALERAEAILSDLQDWAGQIAPV